MSVSTASPSSAYKKTLLRIGIGFRRRDGCCFYVLLRHAQQPGACQGQRRSPQFRLAPDGHCGGRLIRVEAAGERQPHRRGQGKRSAGGVGDVVKAGDVLVKMDMDGPAEPDHHRNKTLRRC